MAVHEVASRQDQRRAATRHRLLNVAGLVSLLVVWELAHVIVSKTPTLPDEFVPSIKEILTVSLPSLGIFTQSAFNLGAASDNAMLDAFKAIGVHSAFTLARFSIGMVLGLVIGIGLGLLTSLSTWLERVLSPLIDYLRTVPLLALITVFLIWFGKEEIGKLIFMTFAISVIIFANTVAAIRNLDPIYARYAETLGASKFHIMRTVIARGILPELTGGIRVLMGTGWAIVLAAEFIAAQDGLGRILILSQLYFSPGRMVVILLVFMLYSLIINQGVTRLAAHVNRWKD